ncbi:MAG: polysaccharide pyruvyl transferase family protein [Chitinispirillaceae bacterium]|nr:polysaccharide pyruvyl transferase family protein [Chitinispirillaceae bacterium]
MKVGILTYHAPYNFGANLQAYTVVKMLQSKGIEVKVIDYNRNEQQKICRLVVPQQQWAGHDNFITTELPLTASAETKDDLVHIVQAEKFDKIIVGADAVWSFPLYNKSDIPAYFMDWLFESPEIANIPVFSISVANMTGGFKNVSIAQKNKLKECISKFYFLSVRDKWTKQTINKHLFKKEKIKIILPDPVFGIEKFVERKKWNSQNIVKEGKKYFLITFPKFVDCKYAKWLKNFKEIANENGFLVGELPLPEGKSGLSFDFTIPYPIDPIQWFLWIKNSDGFVGLRFHAIISCITTGVPFFSIDSYGNKSILIRIINRMGFYKLGRILDKKSKIYQLLDKTKYKSNRVNMRGILGIPPKVVVNKLLNEDRIEIMQESQRYCNLFQQYVDKLFCNAMLK